LPSETTEVLFARYGPRYRAFVTTTVLLGTMAAVVTTTTVNVAIPDIMGAFGVGQDRAQWLTTGALAAMTIAMLLHAWLIRSFGQRKTFVGALALFLVSLVISGISPNDSVLIVCRIVQGGVAGVLQPLAVYTLFRVFPPEQKGRAMGLFGIGVILGPALGPTLGGLLIDQFNWRYVFYIAVPLSIGGMLLGSLFVPERETSSPRTDFDWTGFVLLTLSIGTLLTGLSNGQREGWYSGYVLGLIAFAGVTGVAFLAWEWRAAEPLVELRVLANGRFAAAATVAFVMGAGLFGSIYLVPLFVQQVQGFTPLAAGLLLMPAGLVMGIFLPVGGFLTDRVPANWLIMAGLICFGLSCYWFGGVDANTPYWTLVWWIVLNAASLRALPTGQLGHGAGMINFFRQLGAAFGVNLLSVMLDRRTFFHGNALAAETAGSSTSNEFLRTMKNLLAQAGVSPDLQSSGAMHYLERVVYAQAYTLGFRDSFLICALVFAIALVPAWMMGRKSSEGGRGKGEGEARVEAGNGTLGS
jgi:DHA2 family multidrug resistance protein